MGRQYLSILVLKFMLAAPADDSPHHAGGREGIVCDKPSPLCETFEVGSAYVATQPGVSTNHTTARGGDPFGPDGRVKTSGFAGEAERAAAEMATAERAEREAWSDITTSNASDTCTPQV